MHGMVKPLKLSFRRRWKRHEEDMKSDGYLYSPQIVIGVYFTCLFSRSYLAVDLFAARIYLHVGEKNRYSLMNCM